MSATTLPPASPAELSRPYDPVARFFHWAVVALLLAQYAIALLLPRVLPAAAEATVSAWHLGVGSTVLLVALLRLGWRLTRARVPPPPSDLPAGLRVLSRGTHWLLYALILAQPLLGWSAASAYGAPVRLAGLVPLPPLIGEDHALGERIGDVHGAVALVLAAVIALHVSGAMYHLLVKRDGVVRRMLPGRSPPLVPPGLA